MQIYKCKRQFLETFEWPTFCSWS